MARQRSRTKRSSTVTQERSDLGVILDTEDSPNTASQANTNTTNGNNTGEKGFKMALSPEQIQALLGSTRTKGQYNVYLKQFLDSGEQGVCVNDEWVDLSTKKGSTLKQGFENAKDNKEAPDGAEFVKVILQKEGEGDEATERVYLINLAAAGVEAPTE